MLHCESGDARTPPCPPYKGGECTSLRSDIQSLPGGFRRFDDWFSVSQSCVTDWRWGLSVVLGLFCMGCGHSDELTSLTSERLQKVANVYLDYVAATGTSPVDADQLQSHVNNLPQFVSGPIDPDHEDYGTSNGLISDRDGEPFVIRFGVKVTDFSQAAKIPIAYEKTGLNGRRLVANLNGVVECLDDVTCRKRGMIP